MVRVELPARGRQPSVVAWCMEIHDLALAKLAAGRRHDLEFVATAIGRGLVDRQQLALGLELMPVVARGDAAQRLDVLFARLDRNG